MAGFSESTVEDATLAWLAELGWAVKSGPDIPPDGDTLTLPFSQRERESYGEVVLLERFRNALLPKLMSREIGLAQAEVQVARCRGEYASTDRQSNDGGGTGVEAT